MKLYSVYDNTAMYYATPFAMKTDVHALRAFTQQCNTADQNNQLYTNTKEFDLYCIGEFNEDNGIVQNFNNNGQYPQIVITGEKIALMRDAATTENN